MGPWAALAGSWRDWRRTAVSVARAEPGERALSDLRLPSAILAPAIRAYARAFGADLSRPALSPGLPVVRRLLHAPPPARARAIGEAARASSSRRPTPAQRHRSRPAGRPARSRSRVELLDSRPSSARRGRSALPPGGARDALPEPRRCTTASTRRGRPGRRVAPRGGAPVPGDGAGGAPCPPLHPQRTRRPLRGSRGPRPSGVVLVRAQRGRMSLASPTSSRTAAGRGRPSSGGRWR